MSELNTFALQVAGLLDKLAATNRFGAQNKYSFSASILQMGKHAAAKHACGLTKHALIPEILTAGANSFLSNMGLGLSTALTGAGAGAVGGMGSLLGLRHLWGKVAPDIGSALQSMGKSVAPDIQDVLKGNFNKLLASTNPATNKAYTMDEVLNLLPQVSEFRKLHEEGIKNKLMQESQNALSNRAWDVGGGLALGTGGVLGARALFGDRRRDNPGNLPAAPTIVRYGS